MSRFIIEYTYLKDGVLKKSSKEVHCSLRPKNWRPYKVNFKFGRKPFSKRSVRVDDGIGDPEAYELLSPNQIDYADPFVLDAEMREYQFAAFNATALIDTVLKRRLPVDGGDADPSPGDDHNKVFLTIFLAPTNDDWIPYNG